MTAAQSMMELCDKFNLLLKNAAASQFGKSSYVANYRENEIFSALVSAHSRVGGQGKFFT